jgi:uncharacterized oligopeptide transporter (OPT) family protein
MKRWILKILNKVPTHAMVSGALCSILCSQLFWTLGMKDFAVFVGLWPSTILMFAVVKKLEDEADGEENKQDKKDKENPKPENDRTDQ